MYTIFHISGGSEKLGRVPNLFTSPSQTAADLDMLRTLLDNLGEHQLEVKRLKGD